VTPLRATYRLQFREGMDFDRAASLAPYLARLGVSHLYASPVFPAAPGSTHGYDVADHWALDPTLGGRPGFERMVAALRAHGLGLILDIVPNHMAAHPANPWWASVLAWGRASPFAGHFDIDWSADRLLLPVLGDSYHATLTSGGLRVVRAEHGFAMEAAGRALPLSPPSWALVLAAGGEAMADLARACAASDRGEEEALAAAVDDAPGGTVAAALDALNADPAALHAIHEAQIWRLAHWRLAREALTYRRFFEVDGLVGVRVEAPEVFEDVHRLVFSLAEAGLIDGVRVDHVDGLADPLDYLRRLRQRLGPDRMIWVEKILHHGEALPEAWPINGTTGYETIAEMAGVFVDPGGAVALTAAYCDATGETADVAQLAAEAKRLILNHNLAAELDALTEAALALARARVETRDLGRDSLRRAIVAMAEALPVYRTYVDLAGAGERDAALIDAMTERARASREVENTAAVDFVAALLRLDLPDPGAQAAALAFARRFQQTTGPVTAKAVEDTVFYRFNRLIGLNEVGGEPAVFGEHFAAVHARMIARAAAWPLAMTAGSTHDTKRGEDARARLYALSLAPERWASDLARWRQALAAAWSTHERPELAWLFFQALLGAWPEGTAAVDGAGLARLSERMNGYILKALREAKARTSWTQADPDFEAEAEAFVSTALDPARSGGFLADFAAAVSPFIAAGRIIGLGQTALRLAGPGVPDIYQGSEAGDFSMVDPDNRRPPDFAALAAALHGAGTDDKQALTARMLRLRAERPDAFAAPPEPLDLGPTAFGYVRRAGAQALVVVAPTRDAVARLAGLRSGEARTLRLTAGPGPWRDVLAGSAAPIDAAALALPERPLPWILIAGRP
jgi:(1->4)-alpha-D-glucan 1-alpha-D-glucosylmutase